MKDLVLKYVEERNDYRTVIAIGHEEFMQRLIHKYSDDEANRHAAGFFNALVDFWLQQDSEARVFCDEAKRWWLNQNLYCKRRGCRYAALQLYHHDVNHVTNQMPAFDVVQIGIINEKLLLKAASFAKDAEKADLPREARQLIVSAIDMLTNILRPRTLALYDDDDEVAVLLRQSTIRYRLLCCYEARPVNVESKCMHYCELPDLAE
jgi:hypothetical protein